MCTTIILFSNIDNFIDLTMSDEAGIKRQSLHRCSVILSLFDGKLNRYWEFYIIFSNIMTLVHVPLIDITDALKDHRLKLNDPLLRSFGSSTKIIIQTDRWDFRSIAMIGLSISHQWPGSAPLKCSAPLINDRARHLSEKTSKQWSGSASLKMLSTSHQYGRARRNSGSEPLNNDWAQHLSAMIGPNVSLR